MTIPLLNPSAELCIKAIHMEKRDEDIVRKCVSRYSRPNTFYATLNWIKFRIENAAKSIFGKSEWQKTKKVIQNHVFKSAVEKIAAEKYINIDKPNNNKLQKLLNKNVQKSAEIYVNNFFPVILLINQQQPKISDELMEKIKALDLETFNESVIKSVNKIFQKIL